MPVDLSGALPFLRARRSGPEKAIYRMAATQSITGRLLATGAPDRPRTNNQTIILTIGKAKVGGSGATGWMRWQFFQITRPY